MYEDHEKAASPLSRADVEWLLHQLESREPQEQREQLDLQARNLQQIDLSYMDLQGANLRQANLRGANLRGTNLSGAHLQGADLREADLDGADLSRALLGSESAEPVLLSGAKLSYARLAELDLRGFDLADLNLYHADLRGTDLRGANLHGADLRGADLSTTLLDGSELRGAMLYRGAFLRGRAEQRSWSSPSRPPVEAWSPWELPEAPAPSIEPVVSMDEQPLSEREAYLFGMNVLLAGCEPARLVRLFPQGFSFAQAHQIFTSWLKGASRTYSEQETQALWIGFAHRICDLYFQNTPEPYWPPFPSA
ncbi:MAG TPA: pentapeptide repeat-containing protein [Ktedonobacteraceae bacterium]|nr:pentapeptide repeat-containing protein [Ktedonobacteraceae bacterium]